MHSSRGESASDFAGIKRDLAIVILLSLPLLLCGLGNHHFWLWDEPFVAESAREMAAGAGWLIPRLNGQPFLEKPPLHYALVALSFRCFGFSPWAARLPSLLGALLTVLGTYFLGLRIAGREAGRWAALLVPTFFQIFYLNHYCLVDDSLIPAVTLGIAALAYGIIPKPNYWAFGASGLMAGVAFAAKGFVGPGLILLPFFAYAAATNNRWRFVTYAAMLSIPVLFAIGLWAEILWHAGGVSWLREGIIANSLGRMTGLPGMVPTGDTTATHSSSALYYVSNALRIVMPWSPALLLPALKFRPGGRPTQAAGEVDPLSAGEKFLAIALAVNFGALSLMHAKRSIYLAPLFPLLACLIAAEASRWCTPGARRPRIVAVASVVQLSLTAILLIAAAFARPFIAWHFEHRTPGVASWLIAASLTILTAFGMATGLRGWARGNPRHLFRAAWGMCAIALLAVSLFCFPRLDRLKSMHEFFQDSVRITAGQPPPVLATNNESLTGMACLYLNTTLQAYTREGSPAGKTLSPGRYVIADEWGLTQLDTAGVHADAVRCGESESRVARRVCLLRLRGSS